MGKRPSPDFRSNLQRQNRPTPTTPPKLFSRETVASVRRFFCGSVLRLLCERQSLTYKTRAVLKGVGRLEIFALPLTLLSPRSPAPRAPKRRTLPSARTKTQPGRQSLISSDVPGEGGWSCVEVGFNTNREVLHVVPVVDDVSLLFRPPLLKRHIPPQQSNISVASACLHK